MRFDPKLVRPDDEPVADGGELQLPDDLAALAQQLSDDAQHLSRVYPAATMKPTAGRPAMRWSVVASIVGVLATAMVIVVALSWESTPDFELQSWPAQSQSAAGSAASPATTTVSLTELSPPELEAVLDVLERNKTGPVSVSF